jgi:glucose-1-phosphate adenylyltransferase
MLQQHVEQGADVTVGCLEVPRLDARAFGVMAVDETDRIVAFVEKPQDPPPMPGRPDMALASMGIYVFDTELLVDILHRDAADPTSSHDFGKDIIPRLVKEGKAVAHPFSRSAIRPSPEAPPYWRDVGTIDSYFAANIDLTEVVPDLDLYDHSWPIWTYSEMNAPAKFVHDEQGRRGGATSSLVAGGCVISGSTIWRSLLFSRVRINSYSQVELGVIMPDVTIGRNVRLRNVIVDRGVTIPEGLVVGEDPELDAQRFRRSEGGVCLITQKMIDRLSNT